jgi:hypothetical protein
MADQNDFAARFEMALSLDMDLGDQRAGGVQKQHIAALGLGRDRLGHAMG